MITIDLLNVEIDSLVTHRVGNRLRDEGVELSKEITDIDASDTAGFLKKYLLSSFEPFDFQRFSHSVQLDMNEVYTIVNKIFQNHDQLISESQNLAKLLYEHSNHPKIKSGELNIALLQKVYIDNEEVNAIGIFKSENNVPFIQMVEKQDKYSINHQYGFELKGIDKGCLIFNKDESNGYYVLVVDKSNKFGDTQYWTNDFLQLSSMSSDYHHTKEFMNITREYVKNRLSEEFEVDRTEKIDLLNRTMEYFKKNEVFDRHEFESDVLQDEHIIHSFQEFDHTYKKTNDLEMNDSFEISNQAVKKQSRAFKSVLKLDKNFHVYIHGDKNLIQKGIESDGRKFYKIYYDKED